MVMLSITSTFEFIRQKRACAISEAGKDNIDVKGFLCFSET